MTIDELLQRWSDGSITAEELRELTAKLAEPEHQSALLDDWLLESSLPDRLPGASVAALPEALRTSPLLKVSQKAEPQQTRKWTGWFSWRPLTAAAAGIVFGMFCTSVVFGFGVSRSLEKVVSLLQESFESGPAPLVTGVPPEPNVWSGDYSEFVGAQQGVNPAQGKKMLRVLRSDFEGKTSSKPSIMGDVLRVIDVRPYMHEANGGEVVITLSALFNAAPFPEAESYDGEVTLYALGLLGTTEETVFEDALAYSNGKCGSLDRDPATWQSASTRLLLPPGAEFVMIKVSLRRMPKGSEDRSSLPDPAIFAGHFVDEVRASVSIRKAVADHSTKALP